MSQWWHDSPSWLASLILHAVILLMLALWVVKDIPKTPKPGLTVSNDEVVEDLVEPTPLLEAQDIPAPNPLDDIVPPQPDTDFVAEEVDFSDFNEESSTAAIDPLEDLGAVFAPSSSTPGQGVTGVGMEGRGTKARSKLARLNGGGEDTEQAVALALKWLAAHQRSDGSWSFQHSLGACQGRCGNNGTRQNSDAGATALALLPFLGAGQTHLEGEYKETVKRGLFFLVKSMQVDATGGKLVDGGTYYSHGLASIVLCEAYGMTGDRSLAKPAQLALNHIMYAQDPSGGGWRYYARSPGDTSVVGWQIMALKSGHMAYLEVSPKTIKLAEKFLDSVQVDYGEGYGYVEPQYRPSMSAVGLLCRMYMGWKNDRPELQRGVERLAQKGPDDSDHYYNYYANQVLFQFSSGRGKMWDKWNNKLKAQLLTTQSKKGHETGSWYSGDGFHNDSGGRLYVTALSTMMLEVYYRHLPIFKEDATETDFPE